MDLLSLGVGFIVGSLTFLYLLGHWRQFAMALSGTFIKSWVDGAARFINGG